MQDIYRPFERIERPMDPPEPEITESGFFDPVSEDFIPDSMALEHIGENWDLMPDAKIAELQSFLVDWFFEGWDRVEVDEC